MTLTGMERRWAEIIGRTMLPKGILGGVVDEVSPGDRYAEETRTTASAPVAFLYRVALLMVWFCPPFMLTRACTFGSLSEAERVQALEALLSSRIYEVRMIATVLKITVCGTVLSERAVLVKLNAYGLAEAPLPLPGPEGVKVSS